MTVHRVLVTLTSVAIATSLAACGSDNSSASSGGGDSTKVGMVLAAPKNDGGFAQTFYDGLTNASADLDAKVSVVEQASTNDEQIRAFTNLAADNDLVIGIGGEVAQAATQVAGQEPSVTFVVVNGQTDPSISNLHAFTIREGAPAYVGGAAASALTESKIAAVLSGLDVPPAHNVSAGFAAGLTSEIPDAEVLDIVVGDFNDPQKAYASATTAISQGADVIYAYLSAGFPGVVRAVADSGEDVKILSNVSMAKCEQSENVAGISNLDGEGLMRLVLSQFQEGDLTESSTAIGIEDPDVQAFRSCPGYSDLDEKISEVTDQVNSGGATLPDGI